MGRGVAWVSSCAAPFLLAGLFAIFLGAAGLLPITPAAPVTAAQLPPGNAGVAALVSVALLFVLAWLLRAAARRRYARPDPAGAGAALLATGSAVTFLVWLGNPYTALLLVVPLHVWLIALTREGGHSPLAGIVALVVSLALPVSALALVCIGLRISAPGLMWTVMLLVAGGGMSFAGLLLGSVACGCAVAAGVLLLVPAPGERRRRRLPAPTYAGSATTAWGSLGGTRSALRR